MRPREAIGDFAWVVPYAYLVATFWFVTDDSCISFRYAMNLADGNGLRYNLGESPPVEGYSNLLWVLLAAAAARLGVFSIGGMLAVSVACGAALIHRVRQRLADPLGFSPDVTRLVALGLAAYPPFAVWSTGGLATMPYALLAFLVFDQLFLVRRVRTAPAAACLILLLTIRTEGFVWCGIALGLAAFFRADRKRLLAPAIWFFAAFAALTACRLAYHGSVFSGPTQAKTEMDVRAFATGARYVFSHGLAFFTPLLLPIAAGIALRRGPARYWVPAVTFFLVPVAGAIAAGGDFMTMGRFLVPGFAFGALCGAALLAAIPGGAPRMAAGAVLIAMALLPATNHHVVPRDIRERFLFRHPMDYFYSEQEFWRHQKDNQEMWRKKGLAFQDYLRQRPFADPHPKYVTLPIGAVGLYSDLTLLDRPGLVTPSARVAEYRIPADEALPGHRYLPPRTHFLPQKPEILWARLINQDHPAFLLRACSRAEKELRATEGITDDLYAVDFQAVGADRASTLILWRRIDGDPDEAWGRLRTRMDSLRVEAGQRPGSH